MTISADDLEPFRRTTDGWISWRMLTILEDRGMPRSAFKVGTLSANNITDRLRGRTRWSADDVVALRDALGCGYEDLFPPINP
jgi:hypothetical protein